MNTYLAAWEMLTPQRVDDGFSGEFYFLLEEHNGKWSVRTVDKESKSVTVSSASQEQTIVHALQLYDMALSSSAGSWVIESSERSVLLTDRPELAEAVLNSGRVVIGRKHSPLTYHPYTRASAVLNVVDSPEGIEASVNFMLPDGKQKAAWDLISCATVRVGRDVYPTAVIPNPEFLKRFSSVIPMEKRSKFFSLFRSFYPSVEIEYSGYELVHDRPVQLHSAILFEQVADDLSLYLRIVQVMEDSPIRVIEPEELSDIDVLIDDEAKLLRIRKVLRSPIDELADQIEKRLKRLQNRKFDHQGYCREGELFIIEKDLTSSLLEKDLISLLGSYPLLGTKALRKLSLKIAQPSLRLNMTGSGIDFLEGFADIMIDDQSYELQQLLKTFERQEFLLLHDGSRALIDKRTINKIQRLLQPGDDGRIRLSIYDLPLLDELTDREKSSQEVALTRDKLSGFSTLEAQQLPDPVINAKLRPYQKKGYTWLYYLYSQRLGGVLADDMGLGKTIQSLALLSTICAESEKPILIVMPKSLLFNWKREIETFTPKLDSVMYHGVERNLEEALEHSIILTTYHTVRNDIMQLKDIEFTAVILDESQHIKNTTSKIFKASILLRADWRLALSGTPVENNIFELYALFRFLNPRMFGSLKNFRDQYGDVSVKQNLGDLKKKIYPFLLRRLKREVLTELPAKHEQVLYVTMSPSQAALYESRRKFYQKAIQEQIGEASLSDTRFFLFQALGELRQIASTPQKYGGDSVTGAKVQMLCEWVKEAIDNDHKVLVFASFLEAVGQIKKTLVAEGIPVSTITGSTSNRSEIVDEFQHSDDARVLVMTLKTGGVGLNLTAADYVFIFDPWWNRAAEQQAIDRTHRIGQTRPVFSYKLVAKDTIEEKILQLQNSKKELVEALIQSDSSALKLLSEEDIDFILSDGGKTI
ncbi:MAG: DEAD/DEAH box helicase [Spirochaetota bacterium]